jgi:glyoxylase-like metal-dependent hydrolase (beta-lactamase superfamily II)
LPGGLDRSQARAEDAGMGKLLRSIFVCSFLAAFGCASPAPSSPAPVARKTEITVSVGDPRIGTYVSSWNGFRTSSYWIEGPTGLILIDTQFLLSAAEEFVDSAERITGKKAVLAIVLHPNPDKFNGTAIFQKRGIRVVTSQQVLARIPAVHKLRTGWFYERFKPDYPSEEPRPESFGDRTTELSAGGVTVKAHVLGAGCSEAHVVVEFERNVFVGDLVTIGFHSWLELGLLDEWLARLDEIEAMEPKFVRTGRGGTGESDALTREREYLETVVKLVRARGPGPGRSLSGATKRSLLDAIVARYPAYDYPKFAENGLGALWSRMSAARTKKR